MSVNQLDVVAKVAYPEKPFTNPSAETMSTVMVPRRRKHSSLTNYFADIVAGVSGQPALNNELTEAATYGDIDRVKALLEDGADPKAGNSRALRISAANGHYAVVRLLLENRADVHANNDQALCDAACGGYADVVEVLLDHGADPDVADGEALRLAKQRVHESEGAFQVRRPSPRDGHTKVIKLLKRASTAATL